MRFWDSSGIVPLLVAEPSTPAVEAELDRDPRLVVWWATEIECASAIARMEREGDIPPGQLALAAEGLTRLAASWQEVQPGPRLRQTAKRLVLTHPLRAADAMQLAAAIIAAHDDPRSLQFVTRDERLALAASREGFPVVIPGSGA